MSDIDVKLAELQTRKAAREAEREAKAKLREVEKLELEEKLAEETSGTFGIDFAIVDTVEGLIGLKLGDIPTWKKFRAALKNTDTPSHEAMFAFVAKCVIHPGADVFALWADKRPGILVACTNVLVPLYRGEDVAAEGK
jgi:hypothetical protein